MERSPLILAQQVGNGIPNTQRKWEKSQFFFIIIFNFLFSQASVPRQSCGNGSSNSDSREEPRGAWNLEEGENSFPIGGAVVQKGKVNKPLCLFSLSAYLLALNLDAALGYVWHNRITKAPVFWPRDQKYWGYFREGEPWDKSSLWAAHACIWS